MASSEYAYQAIDIDGKSVSGRLRAESPEEVRTILFTRGLAPRSVKALAGGEEGSSVAAKKDKNGTSKESGVSDTGSQVMSFLQPGVPTAELVLFTKQFRTLYRAGISLPEIFGILTKQTTNKRLGAACAQMEKSIREGESLRRVFLKYPKIFSDLYVAMIEAGERSGALTTVLDRLIYLLEHEEHVRSQVKAALRYPKIVLFVMVGAFLVLLNYVVPQFAAVYAQAKVELPLPTVIALALNRWIEDYFLVVLGVTGGVIWAIKWWLSTPSGRLARDHWTLYIPIIGPLVRKAAIARFAAIFSILQQSGVTILESMDVLRETLDNAYFRNQFDMVKKNLREGGSVAESLGKVKGFTPLAVSLILIGEKSSHLDEMMDELAKHYDVEVEMQVDRLTEYLGPALILCLGVVVLFFALAIFLPMWDLVKFVQ